MGRTLPPVREQASCVNVKPTPDARAAPGAHSTCLLLQVSRMWRRALHRRVRLAPRARKRALCPAA